MGRYSGPYKTRRTLEEKDKIRREYKVPLPDERILFGQFALDLVAKHGNDHFLEEEQKQVLGRKISAAVRHACDFTKVFPNGMWEHHFQ